MNKFILTTLVGMTGIVSAAERYKDRSFDVEITKDVVFAKNVPQLSDAHTITTLLQVYALKEPDATIAYFYNSEETTASNLLMDIYKPKKDTATKRAAVIVSHGGAFVAGSRKDKAQHTVNYCDSLAARGFVTASIEYRLGLPLTQNKNYQLHIDSTDFARTVYRGVQDIRAAVRYMRKNADKLGIDPNRIYLVGNSAGAILSLENIYASTQEDFPDYIYRDPNLGSLDQYGESGEFRANGAVALWGALHSKKIIGSNNIPVLLVHGTADETVLFKTVRPLSNIAGVLKNLIPSDLGAQAASYTLDLHAPTLYGSVVIDSILTAKSIDHETYFAKDQYHEFYDDAPYTDSVQTRTFNFLYKLATSAPVSSIKPIMLAQASSLVWGESHLSFTVNRGENKPFAIYNIRGQSVFKGRISKGETINLGHLSGGVYMLRMQGELSEKFVIRQ